MAWTSVGRKSALLVSTASFMWARQGLCPVDYTSCGLRTPELSLTAFVTNGSYSQRSHENMDADHALRKSHVNNTAAIGTYDEVEIILQITIHYSR